MTGVLMYLGPGKDFDLRQSPDPRPVHIPWAAHHCTVILLKALHDIDHIFMTLSLYALGSERWFEVRKQSSQDIVQAST